jgi:hypothetical protein
VATANLPGGHECHEHPARERDPGGEPGTDKKEKAATHKQRGGEVEGEPPRLASRRLCRLRHHASDLTSRTFTSRRCLLLQSGAEAM